MATLLFHGTRGLYETTEGRYAECARETCQTGRWLVPTLNGKPHWTKPPLTYWAIGVPVAALGPTTWAARLYLVPCYLIAIASVWWLAFMMWEDRLTAGTSAMVYTTMAMPLIATQAVSTDYLLTAALAVAQACFWTGIRRRSAVAMHAFWGCMGVAFLVKGPPALLIIPAAVAVGLRTPKARRRQLALFSPVALALFAVIGGSWYAWAAWRYPGLLTYWLRDEVVNRSLTDKFFRNPFFYCNFTIYLPVLLFGSFPWTGWLAWDARRVWARLRGRDGSVRGWWSTRSERTVWLAWVFLFPLAVFMLSRSKLPLYVLPLFIPLAVAAGRLLTERYGHEPWFGRRTSSVVWTMLAVFVVGKALVGRFHCEKDMRQLHRVLVDRYGVCDVARLAVAGRKPLNGLSFYYGGVVTNVSLDAVSEWGGGEGGDDRFLLCDRRAAVAARRELGGRVTGEHELSRRRRLLRVSGRTPDGEGTSEVKDGG